MARNLQEGGKVIQLVDSQLLQIKFTNFIFEDTPSGHMMLGIFFVFAEHYSKKLSEDSTRGQIQASREGKTDGVKKLGYTSTEDSYWVQHPINAAILRKAFERKMYDDWSDESIAEEINCSGWTEAPVTASQISSVNLWQDSFFYGRWERTFSKEGLIVIPLLELNNHPFRPLLTKEEFFILQERLLKRNKKSLEQRRSRKTKLLDSATPLGKSIVIDSSSGDTLKFSIPNKKRHQQRLETLQKTRKDALYGDVIEPHQIKYALKGNNCTFSILDKFIYQKIKDIKLSKRDKQAFLYEAQLEAEQLHKTTKQKKKSVTILRNRAESDRDIFKTESRFGVGMSESDKELYEKKVKDYNRKIKGYDKTLEELEDSESDELLEISAFTSVLLNIAQLWQKTSYVQKRKLSEILLLNIKIKNGKPVSMKVKPEFESLFPNLIKNGGAYRI